ncbi:hypothetical protein AB0G49_13755 [Streptomyces longwoodensis]|uniref:hypothetical protein n=1 Tax=Streptomyces longwoodensis TaxID=68231 RepID=UPI0033EBE4D8
MAQVRVMGDEDEVAAVLEVLLPFVQTSTAVVASAPQELGMRGPGRRVVFELLPAAPGPVTVERADQPAPRRRELRS